MARKQASSIHRGFYYDWGFKKATNEEGSARMRIFKDGVEVWSMDDDGKDTSSDTNGPKTAINQSVTTTGDVTGFNSTPRLASGVDGASLTALKAEPHLKGTNSLSGDYRAIEINLDDTGTNTIAGDAIAIRVFSQLTINPSGDFAVMEVEAQGSGGVWDYFVKLPNDSSSAWTATTTDTESGNIKVKVGSATRYIKLWTKAPA